MTEANQILAEETEDEKCSPSIAPTKLQNRQMRAILIRTKAYTLA